MPEYDYEGAYAEPARNCDNATYSLIAGLVGWFLFPVIGAIAAVVLGHMALSEIRRSNGALGGRGMAVTGLLLGYAQLLLIPLLVGVAILGVLFLTARVEEHSSTEPTAVQVGSEAPEKFVEEAFGGPQEVTVVNRRSRGATRAELQDIRRALDVFKIETGAYPTADQGLDALLARPEDLRARHWGGPYLEGDLKDPWGNPYRYVAPSGDGSGFDLFSLGPDGTESKDDVR